MTELILPTVRMLLVKRAATTPRLCSLSSTGFADLMNVARSANFKNVILVTSFVLHESETDSVNFWAALMLHSSDAGVSGRSPIEIASVDRSFYASEAMYPT